MVVIVADINRFKYFLRLDNRFAIPGRKCHYEGLKNNGTQMNVTEAEVLLKTIKSDWPLFWEKV